MGDKTEVLIDHGSPLRLPLNGLQTLHQLLLLALKMKNGHNKEWLNDKNKKAEISKESIFIITWPSLTWHREKKYFRGGP